MQYTSEAIEKMVEIFSALPTIGRKTAQRLTFYLLREPADFSRNFADTLIDLKEKVHYCSKCFNYTENDPCPICSSAKRDNKIICVVEEPNDVLAIEKTSEFFGYYHVLHGVLNPLDGVTPEDLKVKELLQRIDHTEEVILALNSSVEGEATTQYLSRLIKPLGIKVSRIASGIPIGSSLEFSDEATLSRAMECRIAI